MFKPGDKLIYKPFSYMTQSVTFLKYIEDRPSQYNIRYALVKRPHRKTPVRVEAYRLEIDKDRV